MPSLLGISVVLFAVFGARSRRSIRWAREQVNVPPEVAVALRTKVALDDPIALRYLRWLSAMVHGDWGFSFVSRMDVDILIGQRLPATLLVIGSSQILALLIASR